MKTVIRTGLRIIAVLVLVAFVAAVWNRERLVRLYHVTSLFDAENIVGNFSHMADIFFSAPIPTSGEPRPWPVALAPMPETYAWQGETKSIADRLERTAVTSLVVVRDGTIVAEDYYLGTTREDRRISWSMAKSFLSALFGIAVGEGKIASLDARVTDYVPELAGGAYEGATIRNVLNMASGIRFNEDYLDFNSDINRMGRVLALGKSMNAFAAELKEKEREPGTARQYVSIDTHVLGMVLSAATGKSVIDYFAEKLWSKLGPEGDAYYLTDGYGVPFVLGGPTWKRATMPASASSISTAAVGREPRSCRRTGSASRSPRARRRSPTPTTSSATAISGGFRSMRTASSTPSASTASTST